MCALESSSMLLNPCVVANVCKGNYINCRMSLKAYSRHAVLTAGHVTANHSYATKQNMLSTPGHLHLGELNIQRGKHPLSGQLVKRHSRLIQSLCQ